MMRRYQSGAARFSQPDPWDGSYDFSNPQSMNRYAYTQNDPVNFVDPTGLQCMDGYLVVTRTDVKTGKTTETWTYLYTQCDNNGHITKKQNPELRGRSFPGRPPGPANPLAPKVGPTVDQLWQEDYNACLKTRAHARETQRSNRGAQFGVDVGWAGATGAALEGGGALIGGVVVASPSGPEGQIAAGGAAAAVGGVFGFIHGSVMEMTFGQNGLVFGSANLNRALKEDKRNDQSVCTDVANEMHPQAKR